ncbi:fluoride efflux transporter CrcB [Streptomyces thinghirensis]|uniref:Fluoride-specific ion channel FluC n=1 Tax=Streptomyces thinghirensis TaxID=551547 RepID=A0ABP9T1F0_9ACTN
MTAPNTESAAVRPARRGQAPVVVAVSLGGGTGAAARYAASLWWPTQTGGFPWTTFWVNVAGCALIGVLMVVVTEVRDAHRLVRPFLGTGVLGGFTTFSTYAVDLRQLFAADQVRTGLLYLAATPLAALAAVWLATWATRRASPPGRGGDTDAKGEGSS